jgi:uncharacterized protein YjbI with pentapeptide repeats
MSQQPEGRPDLRADCAQCAGLCCVALALTVSDDFAIDKPAGQPCPNLKHDFRCGIHARLEDGGFPGCTVYDCFGAGQKVTQVTFGGRDWRQAVDSGALMFEVFSVVRLLHELLWYLTEALALAPALHDDIQRALDDTERHTLGSPESLADLDVIVHRSRVNTLLLRTSAIIRAGITPTPASRRGANLIGASLRGADLRGVDLRSACLTSADLRDADLTAADLIGADLRDTDLRGANLAQAIFLTQPQLNASHGNSRTTLPPRLTCPPHWP